MWVSWLHYTNVCIKLALRAEIIYYGPITLNVGSVDFQRDHNLVHVGVPRVSYGRIIDGESVIIALKRQIYKAVHLRESNKPWDKEQDRLQGTEQSEKGDNTITIVQEDTSELWRGNFIVSLMH